MTAFCGSDGDDEPARVAPVQGEGAAPVCRGKGENPDPADWPDAPQPHEAPEVWPEHADPDLDRPGPLPFDEGLFGAGDSHSDRRSIELKKPPRIDWAKVAAAHKAKGAKSRSAPAAPLPPAPTRESCPRCGVPGWKGCDHFAPCEDQPRHVDLPDPSDPSKAQQFTLKRRPTKFTGLRQGIGASRL